ncbi:MAG TPA: hypothetical protein VIQ30_23185 [Pseudonocardia sp.]
MTEWMFMRKDGIDAPAQVTRESFRLCHEPHGWVEYIPPAPEPVTPVDVEPPADETSEPTDGSTTSTPRRRSAAPKE